MAMTLNDLRDLIPPKCSVGITDKKRSGRPYVDSWEEWMGGRLKTLDVTVLSIESAGYLLLTLDI